MARCRQRIQRHHVRRPGQQRLQILLRNAQRTLHRAIRRQVVAQRPQRQFHFFDLRIRAARLRQRRGIQQAKPLAAQFRELLRKPSQPDAKGPRGCRTAGTDPQGASTVVCGGVSAGLRGIEITGSGQTPLSPVARMKAEGRNPGPPLNNATAVPLPDYAAPPRGLTPGATQGDFLRGARRKMPRSMVWWWGWCGNTNSARSA
jgi:hypothetical protein